MGERVNSNIELETLGINTIRGLAMDAPLAAKSGHQGTAMSLAPLAHVLFTRVMKYDASDPTWADRDRFVLSPGHVSILQYSMLYLTGFGLELEDLKKFRQVGSKTPGHPEAGHTPGVEVTTGPLGQGFANSIGMAISERYLNAIHGSEIVDHNTFVVVSDGDLFEGISHEAASLAGHLGLSKLIAIYDDNKITIDGPTSLSLSDDTAMRFRSYGWDVTEISDSENLDEIENALIKAKEVDKPSFIIMNSKVGYPSPSLTGNHKAHGLAFGEKEVTEAKDAMGLPDVPFNVPETVVEMYRNAGKQSSKINSEWKQNLSKAGLDPKELAIQTSERFSNFDLEFQPGEKIATRKASQKCLTALASQSQQIIGGSADLTGNTGLNIDETPQTKSTPHGRQIYFGIREHAKAAALVGAAQHGGVLPVSGTFLVFADYMRPAIRLAAMTKSKCVFIFTHDSVGVGEDGPTHQPIEQVMSLRAIPGLQVIRPCDAKETNGAWNLALEFEGPTALVLSRQDLTILENSSKNISKGAYEVGESTNPELVLLGTGSEVSLCVDAQSKLKAEGISAKVVSIPCWEAFDKQPIEYKKSLLLDLPAISIEAGITLGWQKYATSTIGIDRFGMSGPGNQVMAELGITTDTIIEESKSVLQEV